MNRRTLSAIVAVVGLVVIGLAVASATVWRPSSTAQTTLAQTPTTSYVVTTPGVLGVVDSDVTVTATAADSTSPVVIAVGRSADVTAWLASDPYTEVTGLSDWETLEANDVTESCSTTQPTDAATAASTATEEADAAAPAEATTSGEDGCTALEATGANPAGSDLWLAEKTGTGSATFEMDASDPDLVILVATDGTQPAPDVSLFWPRSVSTPWFLPGLILGGLLVLVGIFGLVLDIQLRRQAAERKARAAERAARRAAADATATSVMPALGSDPDRALTRREQREKERAEAAGEEWLDPRTGTVHRAGVEVPEVPQAAGVLPATDLPASDGAALAGDDAAKADDDAAENGGAERDAVAGRGSAVVPGLDEATTASLRESRELEDDTPLTLADDAEAGNDGAEAEQAENGADQAPQLENVEAETDAPPSQDSSVWSADETTQLPAVGDEEPETTTDSTDDSEEHDA